MRAGPARGCPAERPFRSQPAAAGRRRGGGRAAPLRARAGGGGGRPGCGPELRHWPPPGRGGGRRESRWFRVAQAASATAERPGAVFCRVAPGVSRGAGRAARRGASEVGGDGTGVCPAVRVCRGAPARGGVTGKCASSPASRSPRPRAQGCRGSPLLEGVGKWCAAATQPSEKGRCSTA